MCALLDALGLASTWQCTKRWVDLWDFNGWTLDPEASHPNLGFRVKVLGLGSKPGP